ncbi:hypothetical protein FRB94_011382 [Tulasnella sp. JGI-2019a]|nr:hypothetical protein FRB94_011382 [Tulasnella sp. JGI-2019a]KAG9024382.1 hypothetical protein FRB95_011558 [Tulasnella sp. JGI-2019a]
MKFSFSLSTITFVALGLAPTALAHGHLNSIAVDGTTYPGPQIGTPLAGGSSIRMINSMNPVKDITSDDMSCGNGAANVTATQSAAVKPGSTISTNWVNGNGGNWPHNVGPLMTYIASCNGKCSDFQSTNAEWLKIDEAGLDNSTGKWIQEDTLYAGKPYTFTFPTGVPAGEYLMRSEIIALHNAQSAGGAEFYPACSQITVAGSSNSALAPPASDEAKFPGGYGASDPGILINVYNPGLVYTFPGPPLAFTTTSTSASNGTDSNSGAMSSATATATAANATSTDDGSDCENDGSDDNSTATTTDAAAATTTAAGNAGMVTVTATAYVTVTTNANAAAAHPTTTIITSVTVDVGAAAATSTAAYRPRHRSRIMARSYFA